MRVYLYILEESYKNNVKIELPIRKTDTDRQRAGNIAFGKLNKEESR